MTPELKDIITTSEMLFNNSHGIQCRNRFYFCGIFPQDVPKIANLVIVINVLTKIS